MFTDKFGRWMVKLATKGTQADGRWCSYFLHVLFAHLARDTGLPALTSGGYKASKRNSHLGHHIWLWSPHFFGTTGSPMTILGLFQRRRWYWRALHCMQPPTSGTGDSSNCCDSRWVSSCGQLTPVDPRLNVLSRGDHKIVKKHMTEAPHQLNSNPH